MNNAKNNRVSFEDMPDMMAELLEGMRTLIRRIKKLEDSYSNWKTDIHSREILTALEVAKMLKVARITVYRMAKRGDIPCYRSGKALLFYKDDVMNWINSTQTNGHLMSIKTVDDFIN